MSSILTLVEFCESKQAARLVGADGCDAPVYLTEKQWTDQEPAEGPVGVYSEALKATADPEADRRGPIEKALVDAWNATKGSR